MTESEQVYAAEENAQNDYCLDQDSFKIEQDAVEGFARSTIACAGFECKVFPFVLFEDIYWAGMCEIHRCDGEIYAGVIYFDPRVLCKWTICHEFSHWLAPGEPGKGVEHNAAFREVMIKLVKHGIGEYASWGLSNEYHKHGFEYIYYESGIIWR